MISFILGKISMWPKHIFYWTPLVSSPGNITSESMYVSVNYGLK